MSNLLSTQEMCDLLGVNRITIWRLRQRGMPFIRVNSRLIRFDSEKVLLWLLERSVDNENAG